MTQTSANNKRIAKNTLMLYVRMLFGMIVSFYTSRVVLATLGITDFGINNVVGGVAAMFSFLNASLSGATSRFLTIELGRNDLRKLKETFAAAFTIHLVLAIFLFILCETVGLWLLEYKLVIPENRMNAARVLFQLSTISSMVGITQVPFSACLISHEKMDVFAYLGVGDLLLKLLIVYAIVITPFDRLITYGILLFCVSLFMLTIYRWYAIKHFEECSMRLSFRKELMIPMLKFSGWDLFGNMSVMLRGQGVNILQNMFWGPAVNAATGVANQIMGAILGFSNNFITAIRPQLVKLYAQNNIPEMQKLAERSSRFSFFLLFFISLPCFIELPFVLDIWLKKVPDFAVDFARWSIIFNWNVTMFLPLMHIIHATGKMKRISLINGSLYILVIPITYLAYINKAANPTFPFVINALAVLIGSMSNLYSVKLYIPSFKVVHYLIHAPLRGFFVAFVGAVLPIVSHYIFGFGWIGFFVTCIVSVLSLTLAILYIGLNNHERGVVVTAVLSKLHIIK